MVTLDKIYHAAFILKDVVRNTDLIDASNLGTDASIFLKTENLQITGSFKVRGAYYKISQLSEEQKQAGIVACSAGNHAQGVALAATEMGIRSVICMPDGAPISKIEETKRLGAEVVLVKGTYDDAYAHALALQKNNGATFVHPFDDDEVIAGQGTIGLEILEQLSEIDAIVVPIGGGGLISGVAYAVKNLNPKVKIYGVQSEYAASMYKSVKSGKPVTLETVFTFADGIAVKTPGKRSLSLVDKYVDEVVTVSEDEIAAAILALIEKQKLISEGAGAVSVAAVMFDKLGKKMLKGKKVVCILSGGNIDVNILSRVITRGLVTSGRNATLQIALEDKPGQLLGVSEIISRCGANIVSVQYSGSDPNMAITSCFLTIGLETKNFAQIDEIRKSLIKAGFQIFPIREQG